MTRHDGMLDKVIGDRVIAVWNGLKRCVQGELKEGSEVWNGNVSLSQQRASSTQ